MSAEVSKALTLTGFYLLLAVGSYLVGNISFARILAKTQNDDISTHGSGNPGATNMLRTHGVSMGFITLILDMIKGAVPSIIGFFAFGGFDGGLNAHIAIYVAGTATVIGHIFPVFYKFKGGKGVATAAGMACVAHPIIALILFGCYIVLLIVTRIGSLSSLIIAFAYVIYDCIHLITVKNYAGLGLLLFVLLLIVWGHRSNIKRLIQKKENVIDLQDAVNKDVERINRRKQRKLEKANKKLNAETVTDNTTSVDANNNAKTKNNQVETAETKNSESVSENNENLNDKKEG